MSDRVVLIGAGDVGVAYAYALVNQGLVHELSIIDINTQKVTGEVMDLNHGVVWAPSPTRVTVGSYDDCADADLVVIGCLDEVATPCLIAARRGGEWCDVGFDDATRDWFDVRAEVVAALVGLHAQSGAPSGCLAAGDAQDEMRPDAGWEHAA